MNIDTTMLINLLKMLLVFIFEKFEVDKEFEAIGIDIIGFLKGTPAPEEEG